MTEQIRKKWQNLVYRNCPCCNKALKRVPEATYVQACPECDFAISDKKYYQILNDKEHLIHTFMSDNERDSLKERLSEQ